jgi:hypothetical protein
MNCINKQLDIVYKNSCIIDRDKLPNEPIDKTSTRIYIGTKNSELLNFDIKTLSAFIRKDSINGEYEIRNAVKEEYLWICVPSIYGKIYFTLDGIQYSTLEPVLTNIVINNTNIEYNCYRGTYKNINENFILEITNLKGVSIVDLGNASVVDGIVIDLGNASNNGNDIVDLNYNTQ